MKALPCLGSLFILAATACFGAQALDSVDAPVICPSIEEDARRRTNYPDEPARPIELVVLGKAKRLSKDRGDDVIYELTADKVLYGGISGSTIKISHPWTVPENEPQIFALVPSIYDLGNDAGYEVKYYLPAIEESSQRALSAARLDFNVLSSESVFVGKEVETGDEYEHQVKVERVLLGRQPEKGATIAVYVGGYSRYSDKKPRIRSGSDIYFIDAVETDRKSKNTVYTLNCRIAASKEPDVVAALGRRASYPVVQRETARGPRECIEIMFPGSTREAIELMASESDAAVTLGARKLIHQEDKVKDEVVAAVREDLFRFTGEGGRGFRRLHNLIQLLREMGEGTPDGVIGKLIREYVSHISNSTVQPPEIKRDARSAYYQDEETRVDANHALAWLLKAMKQKDVLTHFGEELLQLKARVEGQWLKQVQLALDAAQIEDGFELNAALARMKNIKPARSIAPRMFHKCDQVAFSRDGRFLATAGHDGEIQIWNTKDWSLKTNIKQSGSVAALTFAPDARGLYVAGGAAVQIHSVFDTETGTKIKDYDGHKQGLTYLWLSPDGAKMVTASYYEDQLHSWDTDSGEIQKSLDLADESFALDVSVDGKLLAHATGESEVTIRQIANNRVIKTLQFKGEVDEIAFGATGRYLIVAEKQFDTIERFEWSTHISVFDLSDELKLVQETDLKLHGVRAMAVAPDGNRLALGFAKARVVVLAMDGLTQVQLLQCAAPWKKETVDSISFTSDSMTMAVGLGHTRPYIFDTATFKEIGIDTGHSRGVKEIFFLRDGKQLRSIGHDDTVCLWNAATMRLISKIRLPEKSTHVGSSPPDGKYLLCASASDLDTPFGNRRKPVPPVKVLDSETGQVVAHLDLPVNWTFAATSMKWLSGDRGVLSADGTWYYFNYANGKMLEKHKSENGLYDGYGDVTEDSKTLFRIDGGGRSSRIEVETTDIATGKPKSVGQAALPSFTGGDRGLVPDRKHFYIGDPGLFIYDRKTLELVVSKRFKGLDLLRLVFSPNGSRYAVVTGNRIYVDEHGFWDSKTQSIVRVHETLSGKTMFAFPSRTRWIRDLKFSPSGKRLAAAQDDGTIEVWDLPD